MVIIFFRFIILICLVCYILCRGLHDAQQSVTHQKISIRNRQLEELNDLTHVYNDNASIGYGEYMTICVDTQLAEKAIYDASA